jgi:hypothetical protein
MATSSEMGSRNALALIGVTGVETFGSIDPGGPIGRWITAHGSAWHSIEWTVPSLPAAVELTEHHVEGDDRDTPGFTPAFWADEHPLSVVGGLTVNARISPAWGTACGSSSTGGTA